MTTGKALARVPVFLDLLRFNTSFKLHQRALGLRWYREWHKTRYAHHFHVVVASTFAIVMLAGLVANLFFPQGKVLAANGNWSQTTFNGTSDGTYTNTAAAQSGGSVSLAEDTSTVNFKATYDGANYSADYARGTATGLTSGTILKDTGYNSTSSALVQEATTNRVPSVNAANFDSSTTGWSYDGVTISRVTTPIYQGTGSLRIANSVTGGDRYAMTTTDCSVTAGLPYTYSAYVNIPAALNDGGMWLRAIQFNGAAVVADTNLWTTQSWSTSGWQRLSETFTVQSGVTTVELRVEVIGTNAAGGTGYVYVDAVQLEQKTFPTSWMGGTATRTAASLSYYSTSNLTLSAGTVEAWVNVNSGLKDNAVNRYIFAHSTDGATNSNIIAMGHTTGGAWWAVTSDSPGNLSTVSVLDSSLPGGTLSNGWHHFAMTWSSSSLNFYIDGQSVGTPVSNPYLPQATHSYIYVGTWAGGGYGWANAPIDGVAIYNNAKSAQAVLNDFNLGTQIGVGGYQASGSYTTIAIAPTGLYSDWGTLTWNATANGQTITVDVLNGGSGATILTGVASGTNLAISTTTYPSLKLRANLSTSDSAVTPFLLDWSIEYIYDLSGPTAPNNLQASPVSSSEVFLTWDASIDDGVSAAPNDGTISYDVERAPDSGGTPGIWGDAGGTCSGAVIGTSCTDSALDANTKYYYRVRGRDALSNYSDYELEIDSNMKGMFLFNEANGSVATDSATISDCNLVGSPTWGAAGKQGTAIDFGSPNTSRYVNCGTSRNAMFNSGTRLTFELWAKPTALPASGWQWLVAKPFTSHTSPFYQFEIKVTTLGAVIASNWNSAGGDYLTTSSASSALSVGSWTHVAITQDLVAGSLKLYINGSLASEDTTTNGSYTNYNSPLYIGANANYLPYSFTGVIDSALISDKVRTEQEILYNYNNPNLAKRVPAHTLAATPSITGYSPSVNDSSPVITGSGTSAGVVVKLYKDNGSEVEIASTTADGSGNFIFNSFSYSDSLDQNSNNVYVKAFNGDGASNISDPVTIFVDTGLPTAPNTITEAKVSDSNGPNVIDDTWNLHNDGGDIYFAWSGATDTQSTIGRYWVYFGPNSAALPRVDGFSTSDNTENARMLLEDPTSGVGYYFRVQTEDSAGNISSDEAVPTLFTYKFDNVEPELPGYAAASPSGWTTTNNYSFSWPAATDDASGIYGYEYKRDNGTDEWTSTANLSVANIQAYQNGTNFFLLRPVDNAGNRTTDDNENHVIRVPYYYSDPSAVTPQNLQVDLSQSVGGTVNRFKFTWDPVPNAVRYYYSVNATPTLSSDAITDNYTGFGAFATRQEQNTFYLVAETEGGVANWTDPAMVTFSLNTADPAAPTDLSINDVSNKATGQFALTVMWVEPQQTTPDFSGYTIQRSTDGVIFSSRATIDKTNTGYLDTSVEGPISESDDGTEYYYRVLAVDNVGNQSAPSEVVHKTPTGKYTTAPGFTSEPEVSVKATSATVTWTTDRSSNTIVEYGGTQSFGQTQGDFNNYTTDHSYELQGLTPGTTYHFRVQSVDPGEMIGYEYDDAYSESFTFSTLAAPGISDVNVPEVGLYSAVISWKTTSSATSKILYGETSNYGMVYEDSSGSQTTTHTVRISDLTDSTTYNFKIQGLDVDGNILASDNYIFTTLTYPVISNLKIEQVPNMPTSTIRVTFDSNVPTTSQVVAGGKEVASYTFTKSHSVTISGLKDNTSYTVSANGRDRYGNEARSQSQGYKTDFDTRAPRIFNLVTESEVTSSGANKGQIMVAWETDEPATSQIEYGAGSGGEYSNRTALDSNLTTSHVVIISDLKTSSAYHFRAISGDTSGNEGRSDTNTVLTPEANRSVFDEILSALERAIGWLFRD